jgi:hypothetical protein
MDQRESDPTGAFRGGSAGLEDDTTTELERHTPDNDQADGSNQANRTDAADETERDVVTSGIAATSEVADPKAQAHAEGHGDGTPQPR